MNVLTIARRDFASYMQGFAAYIIIAGVLFVEGLLYNGWVDFDAAGVEFIPAEGVEKALRVTLGNSQGERLTTYFFPILFP